MKAVKVWSSDWIQPLSWRTLQSNIRIMRGRTLGSKIERRRLAALEAEWCYRKANGTMYREIPKPKKERP